VIIIIIIIIIIFVINDFIFHINYLDLKERFRHYRRNVGDTIMNAYYVLRDQMLAFLVELAVSQINTPGRDPNQWQVLKYQNLFLIYIYFKIFGNYYFFY